ncbi:MAG: hypothetical protein LBG74_04140 [Spirochaetaceae bacterium]|jgi:N-glycosylase/DNA lyase|nr:hypothetical protein [Spirochaetaceae bacterium]
MASAGADLTALYHTLQKPVDSRLAEFAALWEHGGDRALWREMCFCTCTPQNDAKKADASAASLDAAGLLESGAQNKIAYVLRANGVRFHNNKAASIFANRQVFYPRTKHHLQNIISSGTIFHARALLAETVCGWGLKEASHFLRNTGWGGELCILDRHILRSLAAHNVIAGIPKNLNAKTYAAIEAAMTAFAKELRIPLAALDLVFWYQAKGELFK